MALPKQVQAQLDDVERIEKEIYGTNEDGPENPDLNVEETNQDAREDAQPAPEGEQKVDSDGYEHKFKTLQGKYNAEVPRLHEQVKQLSEQLNQLQQNAEKPEPKPERTPLVTEADREEFGEDLLDVQRRVAEDVAAKYEDALAQRDAELKELRDQISGVSTRVTQTSFESRLLQLVPDFQQVDRDPRFVAWLNEEDPMLRGPRKIAAQKAFNEGDAEAVAHYVGLYKETLQPEKPTQKPTRNTELERQVTPTRNNARVPSSDGKKVYSEVELNKLWKRVADLNKGNRFDEASNLEAELTAAHLEGRIR